MKIVEMKSNFINSPLFTYIVVAKETTAQPGLRKGNRSSALWLNARSQHANLQKSLFHVKIECYWEL